METLMLILAGLLVLGTPLALLICVIILFTRLKAVRRRQDTLEDDLRSLREPAGASPRATPPPLPAMPVEEPETLQPAPSMDPAQKAERILGALRGRDREEGEAPAAGATEGAPAPMAPLDEPLGADEAEAPALVLEDAAAGAAPLDALPEGAAARKPLSFELRLGQNWFNRAGIGVLVIGVVLLFAYYVPSMGGWGKIIASGICGAAMIAGGIILEKREHYRTVALGLIAGGWAVLYSLAYALHNIPALRKIESDFWGLALLFAVAAGMIQHSLSYRSPRVTGAAFLFAVIGITAAPPTTWVPFAIGVLGLAQVIVSRSGLHGGLRISALLVTYAAQLIWVLRAGGTAAGEWTEVLPWVQWGLVAQALVFALSVPRGGERPPWPARKGRDPPATPSERGCGRPSHRF
ncbi:MAG: DUF2339 domain-containing protein [Planctomycetota bacterium]